MAIAINVNTIQVDFEKTSIRPSIENLDLLFYTQRIIDNTYSVIDGKAEVKNDLGQSWYWSDEWQMLEKKVDEYIQNGIIEEFETIDDFIKTLRE